MTVKDPSIKLNQTTADLAVNDTVKLTATTAPKSAASTVTYTTSDEKVATVAADGTVTAVAAGDATITATAKCGSKTVTAEAKVTVKKVILKSVKQTKASQLEAAVSGDTSDLQASDFTITNKATNAVVAVKSAAAKKNEPNTIVIDTHTPMADAKDYSVKYAGVEVTFTATDNTVAKVGLSRTDVPAGELTEVNLVTLDKNDVVLSDTEALTSTKNAKGEVSSEIKQTKGYTQDSSIYLPAIGDTAEVKVTYHSGTYGTDAKETGNIEDTFTITAVDPALVNLNFAVTIGDAPAWTAASFKANDKVKMGDERNAYFRITDDNGKEIANDSYKGYKVETADQTKLLVADQTNGLTDSATAVKVKGVAEGTTYILVKKDNNTVASLPVTVQGKPVATSLDLDRASVTVVSGAAINETVNLTLKDQFGDSMSTISDITVSKINTPKDAMISTQPAVNVSNKTVTVQGGDYDKNGAYTFKVTAKDAAGNSVDRTLTVNRVDSKTTPDSYTVTCDKTTVDTAIGKETSGYANATKITVNIGAVVGGGVQSYVTTNAAFTVKDPSGKTIAETATSGAAITSCAAISKSDLEQKKDEGTFTVNPIKENSQTFDKQLSAGTYTITAKFKVGTKDVTAYGSFTIKDDQDAKASCSVKKNDFGTDTIQAAFAYDKGNVIVTYDGVEQTTLAESDIIKVHGTALANGGAYIKTVELYVKVSGTDNKFNVTVPVNATIAKCGNSTIED